MNGKSAMENTYKYKYKQNTYRRNTSSWKFKVNIVVKSEKCSTEILQEFNSFNLTSFQSETSCKGSMLAHPFLKVFFVSHYLLQDCNWNFIDRGQQFNNQMWPIPSSVTSLVVSGGSVVWKRKLYKQIKLIVYLLVLKISCVQVNNCIKLIMA